MIKFHLETKYSIKDNEVSTLLRFLVIFVFIIHCFMPVVFLWWIFMNFKTTILFDTFFFSFLVLASREEITFYGIKQIFWLI